VNSKVAPAPGADSIPGPTARRTPARSRPVVGHRELDEIAAVGRPDRDPRAGADPGLARIADEVVEDLLQGLRARTRSTGCADLETDRGLRPEELDRDAGRFSVADRGLGIAPEASPRFFDRHGRLREVERLA
jgi:hypothetical protein